MGFLDKMEEKKSNNLRENPLANDDIRKELLKDTTIRIDGDTHTKVVAYTKLFSKMSNKDIIRMAVDKFIEELPGEERKMFDKLYETDLEQRIHLLNRNS